jgi:two-component system OmpR family response regulator
MKTPTNLRILVIEDDLRMVELLRMGLWEHGHTIVTATTAEQGQQLVDAENFDAIVLDIGLPGRSGYTIAQHLRARSNRPAIVMLTALNQEDNIVSAARRARVAATDEFCFGPFRLDTKSRRLLCNRVEVHITRGEYLLLRALALDRGEVVSRRQLMQAVWGTTIVNHGALDTLVNTLREKLNIKQPGLISTARGVGYSLMDDADL